MNDRHVTSGPDTSPERLLDRIATGDAAAESELVRRYSRSVMTMLEFRTGDIQQAEDIHQDTFCIVLQRLRGDGINDPSRIAAFIHKTAVNVLIGEYRKENRRQTYPDSELIQRVRDDSSDQLRQLIRRESSDAIRETILTIKNDRDREILYRFYILQEEKPAICKVLALSSEHFDRVISRARKRFRELLEKKKLALVETEVTA